MPRKRRRRYEEDYGDYDDDEEEDVEIGISKWWLIGIAAIIVLFGVADITGYRPAATTSGGAYEVVSVHGGALHVIDVSTGRPTSFKDQNLVRKALSGEIRKGDLIHY